MDIEPPLEFYEPTVSNLSLAVKATIQIASPPEQISYEKTNLVSCVYIFDWEISMLRLSIVSLLALAACARPAMEAGESPVVAMNFMDTRPPTSISSEDGRLDGPDACVNMRAPGAVHRINVTANDSGGLRALSVRAFDGQITVESIAPTDASFTVSDTLGGQLLSVNYPPAPDGEVFVSTLVIIDVRPTNNVVAMNADVLDRSGNSASTSQFDLRDGSESVICRGG